MTRFIPTTLIAILLSLSFIIANSQPDHTASRKSLAPPKNVDIKTPDDALAELKNGNQRFLDSKQINTNYKEEIEETKDDQHPHSLVLSCLDSRIPPEIIFDQGIGNIFVARVAGNIEDAWQLE